MGMMIATAIVMFLQQLPSCYQHRPHTLTQPPLLLWMMTMALPGGTFRTARKWKTRTNQKPTEEIADKLSLDLQTGEQNWARQTGRERERQRNTTRKKAL